METNITNEKTVVVPKGPITLLMTKNGPIMIVTNNSQLPSQKVLNETKQTLGLESTKAQVSADQRIHDIKLTKGNTNLSKAEPKEVVNILTASATERSKSARAKMLIDGLQPLENTEYVKSNHIAKDTGIQWIKKTTESTTVRSIPSKSNILTAAESERSKSIRAKRLIDSLQQDESTENKKVCELKRDSGIFWVKKSPSPYKRPDLPKRQSENNTKDKIHSKASTSQLELENENDLYSCHKCGEKFKHIDHMMKHFATHRNEKSSTPLAKKIKTTTTESNKITDLKQITEHTEDKIFSCPTCEKKFTQKHSLLSHLLSHVGEKPFSCPICKKAFTSEFGMNKHKATHSQGENICRICAKAFASRQAKKAHMKSIHMKEEEDYDEKYICGVCDMSFHSKSDLLNHLSEHTENDEPIELFEESFLCPYCEEVFLHRNDLIKHFEAVHI